MNAQLKQVLEEYESAQQRAHVLAAAVPEVTWLRRPDPNSWSAGECLAHLNLTSLAFLPVLRDAIGKAREMPAPTSHRYRRDPIGWLLWKIMGPPVRFRVKTAPSFVPNANRTRDEMIAEFDIFQEEQIACVKEADGLPISRVKVPSPFDARVKYNLYACLSILPRHQHRHLWQAEGAWKTPPG